MAHSQVDTSGKISGEQEEKSFASFTLVFDILRQCGLYDTYKQAFIDENIDDEAVVLLDKDDISLIVTKIGDRVKFMKILKSHLQKRNNNQRCEHCNGNRMNMKCDVKNVKCDACDGKGVHTRIIKYTNKLTCGNCGGKGSLHIQHMDCLCQKCKGRGYSSEIAQTATQDSCVKCSGKGTVEEKSYSMQQCPSCDGRGSVNEQ
eukprot:278900_1